MSNVLFAQHYREIAAQNNDERQAMLLAAQQTLKSDLNNEVALIVYSCLAQRDATWQRMSSNLIAQHPENAVARGWKQYTTFFSNPMADAGLQEALRRLLTYQDSDYRYQQAGNQTIFTDLAGSNQAYSIFQWLGVADAARLQLGRDHRHVNYLTEMVESSLYHEAKTHVNGLEIEADKPASSQTDEPEANVYEMLWNCRYCGTEKLLGKTHRFCTVCGAPQDPSWRYFPADEDKVAVKDHKFVGADVVCDSCGNLNSADSGHCGRCGAPLGDAEGVRRFESRAKATGQTFEAQDLYARLDYESELEARGIDPATAPKPQAKKSGGIKRWQLALGVAVLVGICAGIFALMNWTSTATASVVDHSWERTIEIESLQAVQESREGRCSSAPSGAYNEREREEQVDTRRVQVGEECRNVQVDQGDGTFRQERQCSPVYENQPVYGPVCYYDVDRWMVERSVDAAGGLANSITWPDTNITRNCVTRGCEREGSRNEAYVLTFIRDDERFECEVDKEMWDRANEGDEFTIEIGRIGGGERCDTLKPAN